jgi:anti-anti-sigma regulatory factor
MARTRHVEPDVATLKRELKESKAALAEARVLEETFHKSSMDVALVISECFQALAEVRQGNLDVQVSENVLNSPDELLRNLGKLLNDTIKDLRSQMDLVKRQALAIHELSTPVLQIWNDILALPVIGTVDSRRAAEIMERLLAEVVVRKSKYVILDITGVEIVDTKTADHFLKLIKAAALLGTKCILTGIRPAVAQTLVEIGVDLSSITTLRDLQAGLRECLQEMQKPKSKEASAR